LSRRPEVRSHARAGALLGAALLAVLAAGCARREPPSGGPPDLDPPRVLSSSPDSGVAGVPLDSELSITFSEGMEPRTTGDAVSLAPQVGIKRRLWRGRTLTLVLDQPLTPGRTYTLYVAATARDRHANPIGVGITRVFSTGEDFPRGRIEGEITARGMNASDVALWCYRDGRAPDSTARDFDALGLADADGRYRIDGLGVPGNYRLWAFVDLNDNRSFELESDVLAPVDTLLTLTDERPVVSGLMVTVVNPRAPGTVQGAVLDSLPDSLGVARVLAISERDSTRRVTGEVSPEGKFEIQLDPGPWLLRAFRDLDRNRNWQTDREPAGEGIRIVVEPAGEITEIRLRMPLARRQN
jgi:hypothetical protein